MRQVFRSAVLLSLAVAPLDDDASARDAATFPDGPFKMDGRLRSWRAD